MSAQGTALGPMTQASISAAGGTLVSADGRLTLSVPPEALASTQTISIQPASNEASNGAGLGYRLLPAGLTFAVPVRFSFRYDASDIAGSEAQALMIAFQDAQGRWPLLQNQVLDETARTVSAELPHFTDVALFTGYALRPAHSVVGIGHARAMTIDFCFPRSEFGVDYIACRFNAATGFKWAVNGITNGSAAVGTIDPGNLGARFQAPAAVPTLNPVTVSAEWTNTYINVGQRTVVLADVWIEGHPPYSGWIASSQVSKAGTGKLTHTTYAKVDFRYVADEQDYRPVSGEVVSQVDYVDPGAGCEYHVRYNGPIGAFDGYFAIREGDGDTPRYTADAQTPATHTGTTSCTSNGAIEPLTIANVGVRWWPAPPAPNPLTAIPGAMDMRTKDDGSLDASIRWTPGKDGTDTTVIWKLVPR